MITTTTDLRPLIETIRPDEPPALRLTISPRVAYISMNELTTILDTANRVFLYSIFKTKWKRLKSPLTVLCPEFESRRTNGDEKQLLHLHGCVWTTSAKIITRYRFGAFETALAEQIRRFNPQSTPTVLVQDFDSSRSWMTYCTKNYGRDFDDQDTYVFGHNRTGRGGYSVRRT